MGEPGHGRLTDLKPMDHIGDANGDDGQTLLRGSTDLSAREQRLWICLFRAFCTRQYKGSQTKTTELEAAYQLTQSPESESSRRFFSPALTGE